MTIESSPASPVASQRVSFERLRERTDELELIISGLTTVALLTMPGWLLERFMQWLPHLPIQAIAGAQNALIMVVGLSYVLGALFALHLGIRAYWVGLIGLKSVFPLGIRWEHARNIGPIIREDLQKRLPNIDSAILAADRTASTLFAIITLGALSSLWAAAFLTLLFSAASWIGLLLGATNVVISIITLGTAAIIAGSALLVWMLDALLAARFPRLAQSRWMSVLVLTLHRLMRLIYPERLVSPVQLTLQTNTRPRLFLLGFTTAMVLVPVLGMWQVQTTLQFDTTGSQRYITGDEVQDGFNSRYYESQQVPRNRLRQTPMIPTPVIERAWLPLFLPYFALIDDPVLKRLCGAPKTLPAKDCLIRLWQVELNGRPVALDSFWLSQRDDLGFRGLSGFIPLHDSAPGPQTLRVVWNPSGSEENRTDDYVPARIEHHIRFLLAPEWDNAPPPATPATE